MTLFWQCDSAVEFTGMLSQHLLVSKTLYKLSSSDGLIYPENALFLTVLNLSSVFIEIFLSQRYEQFSPVSRLFDFILTLLYLTIWFYLVSVAFHVIIMMLLLVSQFMMCCHVFMPHRLPAPASRPDLGTVPVECRSPPHDGLYVLPAGVQQPPA